MKIRPTDLAAMRAAVEPLDTMERRTRYRKGDFPRADRVRDLAKRYRWDVLYASGFNVSALYAYLDDTHIDTALRSIIEPGAWFV